MIRGLWYGLGLLATRAAHTVIAALRAIWGEHWLWWCAVGGASATALALIVHYGRTVP